jgi:hypothetical protein
MRCPRVGFRLFLLLTTLASVIAATCAVRMRVDYRLSAIEQASRAERPRNLAAYFGGRADELQRAITGQPDSPRVAGMRLEMEAMRERYLELVAEAEYHERLARWYAR